MKDKISTFGGTGFIGGRFCEMFSDDVIMINRNDRSPKSREVLYFISTVDNYNIHSDLHVDIDTNLNVLMDVLEESKKNPGTVFNFVSSWFVYGQTYEIPFREDSPCNPTGFYSITKHCAEQMLMCFCKTFDIKYRIFRLANVLGEGDQKASRKKNALQYMIGEIVKGNTIQLYDDGEVIRDYIYVDDVCSAIKHCIDVAPYNEIINIGNGRPYRLMDMLNQAIEKTKSESHIINIETPNFHKVVQVKHSYLDTKKLRSYGFRSKFTVEEIVDKLISYYNLTEFNKRIK